MAPSRPFLILPDLLSKGEVFYDGMENANFSIPEWVTSVIFFVLFSVVLLGGIDRISTITGKLVPLMVVSYIGAATIVCCSTLLQSQTLLT